MKNNIFSRPDHTYNSDTNAVSWIIKDEANPLFRIAKKLENNSTVLDVGAGNGLFADVINELGIKINLHGIEPNQVGAEKASAKYKSFYQGYLSDYISSHGLKNKYDVIILADVIEHVPNSINLLQEAKRILNDNGVIYLSVPNVAFASLRASLLAGSWDYQDWGLLERTHLRFFTKKTLVSVAKSIEMEITNIDYLRRNPFNMDVRIQDYNVNPISIHDIAKDPLSTVYQFVIKLSKQGNTEKCDEQWFGNFPKYLALKYIIKKYFR
jgi:2-polyprenyl-3-methyl-5-hydroxy-6-metoxy-1,4-benzoquinol methylase